MSVAVILTHGDLDGMACAIMLLRCYPDAALRFGNDRTLARDVRAVAEMEPPPAELLIADIALDPRQHDTVGGALRAVVARGTIVRVFDHHAGWEGHPELPELLTTFCVDAQRTTAAVLVRQECLPHDGEAAFWLSVLSRKQSSPATAAHFDLLAALQDPANYGCNEAILRALARDRTILPEWQTLTDEHDQHRTEAQARALADAETLVTAGGLRLGWIDRRGQAERVFIGAEVLQERDWDLSASVMARKVVLGGAHIDSGVSLRFLHGTHTVDGIRLQVAGHDTPVAITLLDRATSSADFEAAVRKLILQSL
jgi:hypothetical protein